MRNKIVFGIIAVVVSLAIFEIFNLVFPEMTALMGWCSASGIIMAITLLSNVVLVSSPQRLTVKNAATAWVLNVSTVVLFAWTLVYTFAIGSYLDIERPLSGLYIGYLIIVIIALILLLMANRGGSVAQEHSDAVDATVASRDSLLTQMRQIQLQYANIDNAPRSVTKKAIEQNIDLLRSLPANIFANKDLSQQIFDAITELRNSISEENLTDIGKVNSHLSVVLKSLR